MCRRMSRCALLLAACAVPSMVLAQSGPPATTAERPRFYLWSQDGTPCGITPSASSMQVAIVKIYTDDNTSGANAALLAANYIKQHTRTSAWNPVNNPSNTTCHGTSTHDLDLSPTLGHSAWTNTICISIQNFGLDVGGATDAPSGEWFDHPMRFFCQEDRLPDYIGNTYNTDDSSFGFPVNTTFDSEDPLTWYSNRTYRQVAAIVLDGVPPIVALNDRGAFGA